MDSLIQLLSHPYLMKKAVADIIYEEHNANTYERLRSRIKQRHRFTHDEYKKLTLFFSEFAEYIEIRAAIVSLAAQQPELVSNQPLLESFAHPCLVFKALADDISISERPHYYHLYDQMRNRTTLKPEWANALADKLKDYATTIRQHVEQAHQQSNTYRFNYGRGNVSHLNNV